MPRRWRSHLKPHKSTVVGFTIMYKQTHKHANNIGEYTKPFCAGAGERGPRIKPTARSIWCVSWSLRNTYTHSQVHIAHQQVFAMVNKRSESVYTAAGCRCRCAPACCAPLTCVRTGPRICAAHIRRNGRTTGGHPCYDACTKTGLAGWLAADCCWFTTKPKRASTKVCRVSVDDTQWFDLERMRNSR